MRKGCLLIAGLIFTLFSFAQINKPQPGQAPPPFKAGSWLKGGVEPKFGDGKIYVVELWATWCVACIRGMPHLSALARKHKGKAEYIAVNVGEARGTKMNYTAALAKAKKFTDHAGDMMAFHVAMDTEDDYMDQYWNSGSVPHAYVIDGTGKVLWSGHPARGLGEVVEAAIAGTLTVASGMKIYNDESAKWNAFSRIRKSYPEAMASRDYAAALKIADEGLALVPDRFSEPHVMKASALLASDPAKGRAYIEKQSRKFGNAPYALLDFVNAIMGSDKSAQPDFKLALSLVNSAAKCFDPEGEDIMPVRAALQFKLGDRKGAIKTQQRYVEILSDPARRTESHLVFAAKKALKEYLATGD